MIDSLPLSLNKQIFWNDTRINIGGFSDSMYLPLFYFVFDKLLGSSVVASVVLPQLCNLHFLFFFFSLLLRLILRIVKRYLIPFLKSHFTFGGKIGVLMKLPPFLFEGFAFIWCAAVTPTFF